MYHNLMSKAPLWMHQLVLWWRSIGLTFLVKIKMESGNYSAVRFEHAFPLGAWRGMTFVHGEMKFKINNFAPATRLMLVERIYE